MRLAKPLMGKVGGLTIRSCLTAAMLLPADFDYHLLEARHDGGRPKVAEVRHPVPRAEAEDAAWTIVFALQYVAAR